VWAPIGERPVAHGHHRFDWLYVTAFASPATGETFWYLSDGISKPFFEAVLRAFAPRSQKPDLGRIILLVLDNAGWHASLKITDGIRLILSCTALRSGLTCRNPIVTCRRTDQPAHHPRPSRNSEAKIAQRCIALAEQRTNPGSPNRKFHWWPKREGRAKRREMVLVGHVRWRQAMRSFLSFRGHRQRIRA
jgi:hypothetical protein